MRGHNVCELVEPRALLSVTPTFAADANFYTGQSPASVVAGDFNRDGNLDFATADAGSGTVTVRRGRGDGTFRPATSLAVGGVPVAVAAADFNKDGKLDLAVALRNVNQIVSFRGDGAGGFVQAGTVATGSLAGDSALTEVKIVTGDFDGDGKVDLAITATGQDAISVLRGKGTGAFYYRVMTSVPKAPALVTKPFTLVGLAAADLNSDGKSDLIVSGRSNVIDVLRATSGGQFALQAQFDGEDVPGVDDPHDIVIGKLNSDSILDFAVVGGGTDNVVMFRGTGSGNFAVGGSFTVREGTAALDRGPVAIAAGDFNFDGKLDLAVANAAVGSRTVLVNDGTGQFGSRSETPPIDDSSDDAVLPPYHPRDIAVGDFNRDGRMDLLLANPNLNNVTFLKNTTPQI